MAYSINAYQTDTAKRDRVQKSVFILWRKKSLVENIDRLTVHSKLASCQQTVFVIKLPWLQIAITTNARTNGVIEQLNGCVGTAKQTTAR